MQANVVVSERIYSMAEVGGAETMPGPRRLQLASKKQRLLTKEYHRPIMQVIDEWLESGLSVAECAKRIEAETGMPINRNTIYNWLWKREEQRQALLRAQAERLEDCPQPVMATACQGA